MPKVKYDYSEVEEREQEFTPYDGDPPTPGVYEAQLTSCADHTSKAGNDGFRWIFEITQDCPFQGWPGFVYSNLESTNWKTKEITDALGWTDPDEKNGVWDSDKELQKGKRVTCRLQIVKDTYNGETRASVKRVLAPKDGQKATAKTSKPAGGSGGGNGGEGDDPF